MRIVTTWPPRYWNMYVERNLTSMAMHIDGELVGYHEGSWSGEMPGMEMRPLRECDGLPEFLKMCQFFPPARGMFNLTYDYRYDAWKFCRKVFAMHDASLNHRGLLLWIDADCEVLEPFGEAECREWLDGKAIALFQRPGYHSETGFILFDLANPQVHGILLSMVQVYCSGGVFTLPGWIDSYVIDDVIRHTGIPVTNLTPTRATGLDVMAQSPLAAYYRHDKGNRKGAINMAEDL